MENNNSVWSTPVRDFNGKQALVLLVGVSLAKVGTFGLIKAANKRLEQTQEKLEARKQNPKTSDLKRR